MDVTNLSLLKNPELTFYNNVNATKSHINLPLIYNSKVIGIITDVSDQKIYCRLFDKFLRFIPEFRIESDDRCEFSAINVITDDNSKVELVIE
jgi:sugar diacid utilization regulator